MRLKSAFGLAAPLALAAFATGAQAQDLTIATSVPHLGFPFFVHMENALTSRR
jgi:inositol transport system substrate-binding protein